MIGLGLSNTKNEDERFVFHPKDISLCNFFLHSYTKNLVVETGEEGVTTWKDECLTNTEGPFDFEQTTTNLQPQYSAANETITFNEDFFSAKSDSGVLDTVAPGNLGWSFVWAGAFDSFTRRQAIFGEASTDETFFQMTGTDANFQLKAKEPGGTATTTIFLTPSLADIGFVSGGDFNGVPIMIILTCDESGNVEMHFNNVTGSGASIGTKDVKIEILGSSNGDAFFRGNMNVVGAWKKQLNIGERTEVYNWFVSTILQ
tara:strand:+ start:286 stop:1062 length:777 start_codon:yes stop_codon:yes gene_type:complete